MTLRKVISKILLSYRKALDTAFDSKHLFYTNVLLSMTISSCGDLLEQAYEIHTGDQTAIDSRRTFHMGFSGITAGIICHHWYKILDQFIVGKSFDMILKKLFLDQTICSPIVIMSFFASVALFEDNPIENFTSEVRTKFWTLYKAEWIIWPPAQIINFYFLPTRYRVLYDNTISLGYDIYSSQVRHFGKREPKKDKSEEN